MGNRITVEENVNRVKITIPLKRLWPYWATYTVILVGWLAGSIWAVQTLLSYIFIGSVGFEGGFLVAWIVILIIIAGFWIYMGGQVWKRWQYYTANREILFFYDDKLIVRRPLSLLGVTDAYDRSYVTGFRFDPKIQAAVFDYGSFRIPVGATLPVEESRGLIAIVNERFFPELLADEDELD